MIITNDYKFSGNINEVIRSVLNFFYKKISQAQNRLQRTKIKNVHKNI